MSGGVRTGCRSWPQSKTRHSSLIFLITLQYFSWLGFLGAGGWASQLAKETYPVCQISSRYSIKYPTELASRCFFGPTVASSLHWWQCPIRHLQPELTLPFCLLTILNPPHARSQATGRVPSRRCSVSTLPSREPL